jgi:hypothetical protein
MPEPLRLAHGANAIAKAIGKTPRQTFHLLSNGALPGALKLGHGWALDLDVFQAAFAKVEGKALKHPGNPEPQKPAKRKLKGGRP